MVKTRLWRRLDRCNPLPGGEQLVSRCRRRGEQIERRDANPAPHHRQELILIGLAIVPLANKRAMMHELTERIGVIGAKLQRRLPRRDGFTHAADFPPGISEIIGGFRKIRPPRQRVIESGSRLVRLTVGKQRRAHIIIEVGVLGRRAD